MIRSSRNFPTRPTLATQSSSKRSSSKALAALGLAVTLGALGLSACSGRNIHKDLHEDKRVLVRQWTMSTHGPFNAGDRGTEFSNPAVAENTLIFGNRSLGLISIYPKLNQQRWVLPIQNGVISELTIEGGNVYFGGGDGFLYSVSAESGKVNWRYDVRNSVISKPTLDGGRVFVTTSDDTVYAFDAGTGKWLWHYRRRSSPTATILGASSPLVDGQEVITGLSDGFLVALSVPDGQLKWERKLHQGTKFTDVDASPQLSEGIVYVPSYDGALYALKRSNGEVIWRFDAGGSKGVTIEGDRIYLPSSDGNIYALQKSSAKVLWKFEMDKGVPTKIATTDRYLIVGSSFQYLYAIEKNTGRGVYRYNVGYDSGFSGSPGYDAANQRVYFLSHAGNLFAFSIRPENKRIRPHGMTQAYEF